MRVIWESESLPSLNVDQRSVTATTEHDVLPICNPFDGASGVVLRAALPIPGSASPPAVDKDVILVRITGIGPRSTDENERAVDDSLASRAACRRFKRSLDALASPAQVLNLEKGGVARQDLAQQSLVFELLQDRSGLLLRLRRRRARHASRQVMEREGSDARLLFPSNFCAVGRGEGGSARCS